MSAYYTTPQSVRLGAAQGKVSKILDQLVRWG